MKSDNFTNSCETKLSPEMDNVKIRIIRHEKKLNHFIGTGDRWSNLNEEFNCEFGVYFEGYIYINESGYYTFQISHSDGIDISIGSNCSYVNDKCSESIDVVLTCLFTEKTYYQFQLKYLNNYNIPYLDISMFYNNTNYPIEIYYSIYYYYYLNI